MPAPAKRELFLIDGNSLVYRAFFALPEEIATSRGQPTNALFGFASMLVKLLDEHGPRPALVCWDAGMSGREVDYEPYKAEREARPDLLSEQWPYLEPLVEAFGYRNVRVEGYEADDVIATLARQARERGIEVTVVTGDRDLLQVVEPGVRVMATARGITDTKLYDREAVVDRYGIPPELVPDFIGLKGDTSDNIPGVPGIGEKTAAQLLQQFGTLEDVLERVDEVSGAKRKQSLAEHAEAARISKRLATAIRDIDAGIDLEECVAQQPDRSGLRDLFRELELREPLRRLEQALAGEGEGEGEAVVPEERPGLVREVERVEVALAELGQLPGDGPAALAAERPAGDGGGRLLRFAAYAGDGRVLAGEAETLAALTLAWGTRPLVAHDWKSLAAGEADCEHPPLDHDTMVAAYLIDPARRGYELAELAEEAELGVRVRGSGAAAAGGDSGDGAAPAAADALAERAVLTLLLAERQRERLAGDGLERLFREVELPLVEVLVAMQRAGVKLDAARLAEIASGIGERIEALEREIWELAGEEFTIGSPQQLGQVLFEKLGLTRRRRGKTGFSTDARVLAAIRDEHPIVEKVERWRELSKLKSTYLDALPALIDPRDGRLHTTFNQTAAATGRLSSTNPNLQNVPVRTELGREIRSCFVAEEGCTLISADYSQVELRLLAHIAGEEALKEVFRRGEDVHTATCVEIFGVSADEVDAAMRSKAKMVNYGIVYGLSAFGLADRLQIPHEEAAEFIERYLERFPKVREMIDATIERARDEGYAKTLFGRIRRIPELRSGRHQTRQLGERLAVNMVVQGTAADVIKVAMVRCRDELRAASLDTRLVLQIHDELLFEGPAEEATKASEIVTDQMSTAFPLDPPLAIDLATGPNWLEAK